MLLKCLLSVSFFCSCVYGMCLEYRIPKPTIRAFVPRGFEISIPDYPGINLVVFHININRDFLAGEPDKTLYVLQERDYKWIGFIPTMKLKKGDAVHYKVYVQKKKRGYWYLGDPFIITEKEHAPNAHYHRQPELPDDDCEDYFHRPAFTNPTEPTTVEPSTTTTTTTTTPRPSNNEECTTTLNSVLKLLADSQSELNDAKADLDVLKELAATQPLVLHLSGAITQTGEPKEIVEWVLLEKLNTRQNIKRAWKSGTTTISFELSTFEQKLDILKRAKTYLKNDKNLLITF